MINTYLLINPRVYRSYMSSLHFDKIHHSHYLSEGSHSFLMKSLCVFYKRTYNN